MSLIFFGFILLSAFFHAFYNYLIKKASGSNFYLLSIFIVASTLAVVDALFFGEFNINFGAIPFIFGASFFFILYQIFVAKSYTYGNISKFYPLTVLNPLFVPIWAFFLLKETLSFISVIGILVTVFGAILVKLNAFNRKEFKKIVTFSNKEYVGARFAIGASLFYSFGAIFDKSQIAKFDLHIYIPILLLFMAINLGLFVLITEQKLFPQKFIKTNWKLIIIGGISVFISFITFRVALQKVMVSVAVPLRLTSIIFATILGVILLHEKVQKMTIYGVIVIITGIVLIRLGIH